jgi:prevent-host-death family protein
MATISATTARQSLPAQLDRVEAGEEIAITRHGRVVAVLVSPTALATRRAPAAWHQADCIAILIERARNDPLPPAAMSTERADALVEAVNTARQAR